MNLTDEELLVLIAVLGKQSNSSIKEAIEYFYNGVYFTKGAKYKEPFMTGLITPCDDLFNRLLHESNKRGMLKWADDEWV